MPSELFFLLMHVAYHSLYGGTFLCVLGLGILLAIRIRSLRWTIESSWYFDYHVHHRKSSPQVYSDADLCSLAHVGLKEWHSIWVDRCCDARPIRLPIDMNGKLACEDQT